jgi:RNA polymerase sigma-70 factor, ECF subfamily
MSGETLNSSVDRSDQLVDFEKLQRARTMVTSDDLKEPLIPNHSLKETPPACFIINENMNSTPSSEDLMARVAKGDEEAFEILVSRHQTPLLNLTYRFLGNRAQAKDLAQEVFLRVWQAAKTYEPKAKFTTWIYQIAANLCFNELKSSCRRRWYPFNRSSEGNENTFEDTYSSGSPNAEELLLAKERSRQISDVLHSLPGNQRMAVVLKRYDDLSYEEIGQIMDCSVSAVESLLVRAKRTLQEKLRNLENDRRFLA